MTDLDLLYKVGSMAQKVRPCIVHNDIQIHSVVAGQLKGLPISVCLHQAKNTICSEAQQVNQAVKVLTP